MQHVRPILFLLAATTVAPLLVSCFSTKEIEDRLTKRNAAYYEKQEKRQMRSYARDDRYEAWVDRVLN